MTDSTQDSLRGTGRTTNIIIYYVKACIQEQGRYVRIYDHYFKEENHEYVTNKVCDILHLLNVDYQRTTASIMVLPRKTKEKEK